VVIGSGPDKVGLQPNGDAREPGIALKPDLQRIIGEHRGGWIDD